MGTSLSDDEIIARVLGGETESFGILIERYERYVGKVLSRYLNQEAIEVVAVEVFTKSYVKLETFKGSGAFRHWLATIATRSAYNYLAKQKRDRSVPASSLSEEHSEWLDHASSGQAIEHFGREQEQKLARETLHHALEQLTPENRMVLSIVHLEEKTTKEAAELLGWSEVNVRVRAVRARKALKKVLLALEKKGS